jgi:hypothetical protein
MVSQAPFIKQIYKQFWSKFFTVDAAKVGRQPDLALREQFAVDC